MGSISGRGLAFGKVRRSRKSLRQGRSWGLSQGRGKFPMLLALCWGLRPQGSSAWMPVALGRALDEAGGQPDLHSPA